MKNLKRGSHLAVFLFILGSWGGAQSQITPSQDAYTNTGTPTTNYGTKATLNVASASETAFIQFDLSSVPTGYTSANVAKATLKLYVNGLATPGSFNVDFVNGTWSEKTITASLSPAIGTTIASSVPLASANVHDYLLIDVTPAVGAWLDGSQPNDGIALVANSPLNASFDSKENTTNSQPAELDIVFTGGGTLTGVTTSSGSGLTGGGTAGTLNLSLTNSCAANQVLQWNGSAWACAAVGSGSVTSVGLAAPASDFTISGSPVTGSGTLTLGWNVPPDSNATPNAIVKRDSSGNVFVNGVGASILEGTSGIYGGYVDSGSFYYLNGSLFASGNPSISNAFVAFAGNTSMTGATNTAEGALAFTSNTTGCCNVANGTQALHANTQGCCNVASGQAALISNTTGSNNTADGYQALFSTTTGNYNTAIGIDALTNNTTGTNNTALGRAAGGSPGVTGNLTGSGNTFLGTGTIPGSSALNNSTAIGNAAEVDTSNAMVLGAVAGVNGATTSTNVGIGTTSPAFSLDVHGTANFTGLVGFSPSQTFPGAGTITGVTAGAGLAGGGSSGNVSLALATSLCPTGNALTGLPFNCAAFATLGTNTFTGDQNVTGNVNATGVISGDASGLTNLPALYSAFVPTCDLNAPGALSSTPVNMGTLGTFTKQRALSSIVIDWGGHVDVGAVSNVVYFFIEIDGNAAVGGQANGLLFSADAGRYIQLPMHAAFTGLPTGSHNVQMWVSIPNGTGSNVAENPGCYSEQVTIQEL